MLKLSAGSRDGQNYRECAGETAGRKCLEPVLDGNPVALCGRHTRLVYEFAQGVVTANWRDSLRDALNTPDPTPEPAATPSWVYFIRRGDRVKIGQTTDPATRFKSVGAQEVLHIEPGDRQHERTLHALFAPCWVTGEWFRDDPTIRDYIARRRNAA